MTMESCLSCTIIASEATFVEEEQQQQQQQQRRQSQSHSRGCRGRRCRLPSGRRSTKRSCRQGRCATPSATPQYGAACCKGTEVGSLPGTPVLTAAPKGKGLEDDEAGQEEEPTPQSVFDEGCENEVVAGLAIALERMAALATETETLTNFHCVRPPSMSIRDYVERIRKFFGCSIESYVLGLVYIDRLVKRHPDVVISKLSCHRLLITSMMLAAKFQDDVFYTNTFYAKVGGLKLDELNVLEQKMLELLDYRLLVPPSEFELYRRILCRAVGAAPSA